MIDAQVIAFIVVAAALTVTPGADTMLVMRNVLRGGRTDGIITTFGICTGLFVHALLSALGLSIILMHSSFVFHMVKLLGAVYLIWLGWQSVQSAIRQRSGNSFDPVAPFPNEAGRKCFWEGFLNNMLNPKVAVFYLAFLPQFIGPNDPVVAKSILLAGIHYIMGIIWLAGVAGFIDRARRFVVQSSVRKWLDGVCGTVLVALGLRLALEDR